jgi:hypothetical protein
LGEGCKELILQAAASQLTHHSSGRLKATVLSSSLSAVADLSCYVKE